MKSSPLEDAVDILDDILDDHREYDLQYVLDVTFIRNALVAILAGRKQFIPPERRARGGERPRTGNQLRNDGAVSVARNA
jgi:hypothetical protein